MLVPLYRYWNVASTLAGDNRVPNEVAGPWATAGIRARLVSQHYRDHIRQATCFAQ